MFEEVLGGVAKELQVRERGINSGCGGGFGCSTVEMNSCSGAGGGGVGSSGNLMGMGMGMMSPFTVSQWQELEHQALIFKYMMAGMPVPPDLVLPIQKSFESISHRFFHHSTMGYCSFYGKKVDPEPGRCRRTDGKKWRCSKDAYPDSKYCERHMHRGRNRSRKPVESQTITQSSSSVTSLTVAGTSSGTGSFQTLPLNSFGDTQGASSGTNQSRYQIDTIPFGIPNKDYRYLQGLKSEMGEHSFFSDTSGSNRGIHMDSPIDSTWPAMPSRVASFPASKSGDGSVWQNDYPQHSFFNNDFPSEEPLKEEGQSLRPFLDEWPKCQDSWSGLEDDRSNQTSFSTTQLSISIPMTSSDFSGTSSRSPHDD
ncbi:growth-regulating factor 4-like isoform X2 [Argentina anserina]|uniref:growth-regulating factor 4-like isoform X2 n=1 Tax=Argentina anserina TaxID=57926 RepID=UPI0021763191|nr:growth-regulating factor 4-like isoform X2 [Potentilla anserina]